jgi:hypothetical protein
LYTLLWLLRRGVSLRCGSRRRASSGGRRHHRRRAYRPNLENLETRTMPYAPVSLLPFLTAPPAGLTAPESAAATEAAAKNRFAPDAFFGAAQIARGAGDVEMTVRIASPMSTPHVSSFSSDPVSTPTAANASLGSSTTPMFGLVLSLNSLGTAGTVAMLPLFAVGASDPAALESVDAVAIPDAVQLATIIQYGQTHATDAASTAFGEAFTTDALAPTAIDTPATTAVALEVDAPSEVDVGEPVEIMIIAVENACRPASNYEGTVGFSSSDAAASLPAAYTFRPADNGIHVVQVVFALPGSQTITVADAANVLRETVTVVVRRAVSRRRQRRPRDVLDIWMSS